MFSKKSNSTSQKNKKEEKKETEIDISQYKDPTGVTVEKMEKAYWLFRHRKDFKNSLIIFLLLICVIVWGYALWGYGKYLIVGMEKDREMLTGLTGPLYINRSQVLKISPQPLEISNLNIIRDNRKYDLAIKVTNPNPHHHALFNYCFQSGEEKIKCDQDFVLPRGTKYVLALSREINNKANIDFQIKNTSWKRLNYHEISSWEEFETDRVDFKIENVKLTAANKTKLSEEINLSDLSFSITNNSGYGYYKAPFNILLISRNKITALNRYVIFNFKSKEKKEIKITWPNLNFSSGEVKIIPDVNILDPENYMNLDKTRDIRDTRDSEEKNQNVGDVIF